MRSETPPPGVGEEAQGRYDDERENVEEEEFGTGGIRSLADRIGWAGLAELSNLAVTATVAKILTDTMVPSEFGRVQSVIAVAAIVGPLATFGANPLLLRRAVVSRNMRVDIGRAIGLATTGTSLVSLVVVGALVLLPGLLPDISRFHALMLLVGQTTAFWLTELAVTSANAREDLKLAAQLRVVAATFRILAVIAFAAGAGDDMQTWAWYFLVGNLVAAAAVHLVLASRIGRPSLVRPSGADYREGLPYGFGTTTEGVLSASDKPLMSQYHPTTGADGLYALAYRVVTLGLVPVIALFRAQARRVFRQGARGSAASHGAAVRMAGLGLAATAPVAVALFVAAPWLSLVINDSYEGAEEIIRYLALLPVIKGVQFAFGNSLTAAGNQTIRLWLTVVAAVGNLIGNLLLIPDWSWQGAVITTMVAELMLAVGLFIASGIHGAKGRGR